MATVTDFRRTAEKPTWCPGCGDYPTVAALQRACANLGLDPDRVAIASGIGCSGKIGAYFGAYGFHSTHGRSLPVAQGIKLANRGLTVLAAGGDGDGYGIGLGHFVHAVRRNVDITYIVMDNHIYGLTTGQTSPTSKKGFKTKTTPYGAAEPPIRPLELALAQGAGFVAQGFSGEVAQLTRLFEQAIQHRGFALVNVYSPCVTFNREDTYDFWRTGLVDLDADPAYERHDRLAALRMVTERGGMVRGLVFREREPRPSYEDDLPGYAAEPLAQAPVEMSREEIEAMLRDFR